MPKKLTVKDLSKNDLNFLRALIKCLQLFVEDGFSFKESKEKAMELYEIKSNIHLFNHAFHMLEAAVIFKHDFTNCYMLQKMANHCRRGKDLKMQNEFRAILGNYGYDDYAVFESETKEEE